MAAVVVLVDQLTKWLAVSGLHGPRHVIGPFGLALGYNSGSAFSLFTSQPVALSFIALALVAVLVLLAWRTQRLLTAVALGLVLGGALGNLADRAFRSHHGSVVDFITLSHWPTFNVADACITVGLVLAVIGALWPHGRSGAARPDAGTPADPVSGPPR